MKGTVRRLLVAAVVLLAGHTAVAARNIRVYGHFFYVDPDGHYIGADSVRVEVRDQDPGSPDDSLGSGTTDSHGAFDITVGWDDDCTFCESDPDLFVRFVTRNGAVTVESDWFEIDFKWSSPVHSNFKGTSLNVGVQVAQGDVRPLNIHNSITRAWRWIYQNAGYNTPHVEVQFTGMADFYNIDFNDIHITGTPGGWKEGTHVHEYGHHWIAMFSDFYGPLGFPGTLGTYDNGFCDDGLGWGHCSWCRETPVVAWQEGWPDWLENLVTPRLYPDYPNFSPTFDSFETPEACQVDDLLHDPQRTEGFVAALLHDIEDIADNVGDDHNGDGFGDALELGHDEIFWVADHLEPQIVTEITGSLADKYRDFPNFLSLFRQTFPQHTRGLWETAFNVGYDIDKDPPGAPGDLTSVSHPLTGAWPDPDVQFSWADAPDDAAGAGGHAYSLTTSPEAPPTTASIGPDPFYTLRVPLGTWYFNLRAIDRTGKVSPAHASYGPFTVRAPDWNSLALAAPSGAHAVAWGDYDNDGDPDLYVISRTAPNALFRNDGGVFSRLSIPALAIGSASEAAAWGDYDNDGDPDLYVVRSSGGNRLVRNNGGTFSSVTTATLAGAGDGRGAAWGDYDGDGDLDIFLANCSTASQLLRNDGNGLFVDVTSGPLAVPSCDTAAAWADFNGDGRLDLYVAAGGGVGRLLRNAGGGQFKDETRGALALPGDATAAAWGDFNNDGTLDLYVAQRGAPGRLFRRTPTGPDLFAEITTGPQAATGEFTGAAWGDYDNDGNLDLLLSGPREVGRLLRNRGAPLFDFEDATRQAWPVGDLDVAAWADFDGDGDLDVAAPGAVVRNDLSGLGHWLHLDLRGSCSNGSGIGARIRVTTGNRIQTRAVVGPGQASMDSLTAEFGLGSRALADRVDIFWPSGTVQTLTDVPADSRLRIVEPSAVSVNDASVLEGNTGSTGLAFTVWRCGDAGQTSQVEFAAIEDTASAGVDFDSVAGTLTFPPGTLTKTVLVPVHGDAFPESSERLTLLLSAPVNAVIRDGDAEGFIQDDDAGIVPVLSIGDVTVREGVRIPVEAVFTVSLSEPGPQDVLVDYATAGITAFEGGDYLPASGTLTIPAGATSGTLTVVINPDDFPELIETFRVSLSRPRNALILAEIPGLAGGIGSIVSSEAALSALPRNPSTTALGPSAGSYLGWSVSSAGDVDGNGYDDVIVGAPGIGRAYLYPGGPGGAAGTPAWTGSCDQPNARFGFSVAGVGDVNLDGYDDVAVGAPLYVGTGPGSNAYDAGQVFVYFGSPGGLGVSPGWTAWGGDSRGGGFYGQFGYAVAGGDFNNDGAGDIIVGAPYSDPDSSTWTNDRGAVFIWFGGSGGPGAHGTGDNVDLRVLGDENGALLGFSVATGDSHRIGVDDAAVGAPFGAAGGKAYLWTGGTITVWAGFSNHTRPSPDLNRTYRIDAPGSSFGFSVAIAGDADGDGSGELLVGAPLFNNARFVAGAYATGRLFIYDGTEPAWSTYIEGVGTLGYSVASAGDVNADGFDDILVGDRRIRNATYTVGRATLYLGSAMGPGPNPAWSLEDDGGEIPGLPYIGNRMMAAAGDVNGDGFGDLVIGAPGWSGGSAAQGAVHVVLGSESAWRAAPGFRGYGSVIGGRHGASVAVGDVDGDGFGDLVVGAPGEGSGGRTHVYRGSATGPKEQPDWTLAGTLPGGEFGFSVAAGDLNGDGFADLVVGSPQAQRAEIFMGRASGPNATPAWSSFAGPDRVRLGHSAAFVGDVNGDGYGDVAIGAPDMPENGVLSRGRVEIYLGSASGPGAAPVRVLRTDQTIYDFDYSGMGFGWAVAGVGDVDGDGYDDVLIGFPWGHTAPGTHDFPGGGSIYLVKGTASGPETTWSWSVASETYGLMFGESVAGPGDVDGDGYDEILAGSVAGPRLWRGGPGGPRPTADPEDADWLNRGGPGLAARGSVSGAGDMNGDGFAEIATGAGLTAAGGGTRLSVHLGSAAGLAGLPHWVGDVAGGYGQPAIASGDVNGDGFSDIAVAEAGYAEPLDSSRGAVFLYYGDPMQVFQPHPFVPVDARQLRRDGVTQVSEGASIPDNSLLIGATLESPTGEPLRLEVELIAAAASFSGIPTHTSDQVAGGSSVSLEAGALLNGDYRWKCRARDASGRASVWREFGRPGARDVTIADGLFPSVDILLPTSGTSYETSSGAISLWGTASDNNGVVSVTWSNEWGGGGPATTQGITPPYNWRVPLATLHGGWNSIEARARDQQGNTGADVLLVRYVTPPDTFVLAVERSGTGSGVVTSDTGGIDCGDADQDGRSFCNTTLLRGTAVTLVATADQGSVFAGWTGDLDCLDGTLRMDEHKDCTALFYRADEEPFQFTINLQGTGLGAVSSVPPGIDCDPDCDEGYYKDVLVSLKGVPAPGSIFQGWEGDPDCADGLVQITASKTCAAVFDLRKVREVYAVRYNGPGNGNDFASALTVDGLGNLYLAGDSAPSGTASSDFVNIKYGPTGELLWAATYNGPGNGSDNVRAIATDPAGGLVVTGSSRGSSTLLDYVTLRYGEDGLLLWTARYNGPANGSDVPRFIAVDSSGNVYVTGESAAAGGDDIATLKYDPSGNPLWVARYNGPGNGSDRVTAWSVDGSGNVYIAGTSSGGTTGNDYVVLKYSADGNLLWATRYNGPGNGSDTVADMALDGAGNSYVTGSSPGSGTGTDYATIKLAPDGHQLWVVRYNGPASGADAPVDLALDSAGNVHVTGHTTVSSTWTDFATVKYGPDGTQLWVARYDGKAGNDYAHGVGLDTQGNVYVAGTSNGFATNDDFAVVKYDAAGAQLWAARYNGPVSGYEAVSAFVVVPDGNIYIAGRSPGSATGVDYATVKYDAFGREAWVARYDGSANGADWVTGLVADGAGHVYVTGNSPGVTSSSDLATIKYADTADRDGDRYPEDVDCDDGNAAVHPGAPDPCDGLDNDCDGTADEGLSTDTDGDGHSRPGSCALPADDCDDSNPNLWACNTPASATPVTMSDPSGTATVTFEAVAAGGDTTIATVSCPVDLPAGFALVPSDQPICHAIGTTAVYTGAVTVCLVYNDTGLNAAEQLAVRMRRCSDGGLCETLPTVLHDRVARRLCALTTGFSTFGLIVPTDPDADGVVFDLDNCPVLPNADQADRDGDGRGDLCDVCESTADPLQEDTDRDGRGDACDACPGTPAGEPVNDVGCGDSQRDDDSDGYTNAEEAQAQSNPQNPRSLARSSSIALLPGLNLAGFPADPLYLRTLRELLESLGGPPVVARLGWIDPERLASFEAGYDVTGAYFGPELTLGRAGFDLSGLLIEARRAVTLTFSSTYCYVWSLRAGANLVSDPCLPEGIDAFDMLSALGGAAAVASIQRFDRETGGFEGALHDEAGHPITPL